MHLDAQDVPLARARFQASSADWDLDWDIGIARMDLGMRLLYLKAKRNDRGPYTGLHLGPQSDLILHHFFYFITDWLAVGHIRKKCPYFLTK